MAFFNPTPVQFQPSPLIMQGAGAIGDTMQNLYKQNYQEAQDKIKSDQWAKQFRLQQDTFDHTVANDDVKNDQWGKTFDQTAGNNQFNQGMTVANYNAGREDAKTTKDYHNSSLGIQQQTLAIQQQDAARKQAQAIAEGNYLYNNNPTVQKTFQTPIVPADNYVTDNPLIRDVVYGTSSQGAPFVTTNPNAPTPTQAQPVKYGKPDDKTMAGIGGMFGTLGVADVKNSKWVDTGDKQVFMSPTGEILQTLNKSVPMGERSREDNNKAMLMIKEYSDPIKAQQILGDDFKELAPQIVADLQAYGKQGQVITEEKPGKFFGTNTVKRYIPYSPQQSQIVSNPFESPSSKEVIETRITEDGRKIAKYKDGTHGYL